MFCCLNLLNHYVLLPTSTLFTDSLNVALKKSNCNVVMHPTIYSGIHGLKNKSIRSFIYQYVKRRNVR